MNCVWGSVEYDGYFFDRCPISPTIGSVFAEIADSLEDRNLFVFVNRSWSPSIPRPLYCSAVTLMLCEVGVFECREDNVLSNPVQSPYFVICRDRFRVFLAVISLRPEKTREIHS